MLGMRKYTKEYVDACRRRVDANVRAYRKQVGKEPDAEFEARYFNDDLVGRGVCGLGGRRR